MTNERVSAKDYPLAESQPEQVVGARGKSLNDLSLDAVINGDISMEDVRITPQALLHQAEIARDVGRESLAKNFERASEMTRLGQDEVMEIYELLRPGRAESTQVLLDTAKTLREKHGADQLALFLEEAADIYDRRGLFVKRY
ncbi:MAG: glycerol dehydratase [Rhodospirillales bacterium]|jgi:propanediol dehydratase small subunit|nr:glycerol dehydratase [Rhodospirillales bacterium]MBT4626185.1 glycerol dehydratase [Rhodospirillales bacterium]